MIFKLRHVLSMFICFKFNGQGFGESGHSRAFFCCQGLKLGSCNPMVKILMNPAIPGYSSAVWDWGWNQTGRGLLLEGPFEHCESGALPGILLLSAAGEL